MDAFVEKHLSRIKNIMNHGLKISTNWDMEKSFDWMLKHSKFIFSHRSYGGLRISLVIDEKLQGRYDCFEIGYDRWGIKVKAATEFNSGWGNMIIDSSKNVISFIKEYLHREGADDLFLD